MDDEEAGIRMVVGIVLAAFSSYLVAALTFALMDAAFGLDFWEAFENDAFKFFILLVAAYFVGKSLNR